MPLLTRLALVILAGAGVLAALGCGGARGDKTFEGEGYTFTYPGDWAELIPEVRTGRTPDVLVGPPEPGWNGVGLVVIRDAILEPFTEVNIDQMVSELRPAVDSLMHRAGAVLEGDLTQMSYAGLPGIRFEGSSTDLDPVVRFQQIWLLDGTTGYTFNCQFLPAEAEEVGQACDLVLSSFQLSD